MEPIERLITLLVERERLGNTVSAAQKERVRALFERLAEIFRSIDPAGPARLVYRRQRMEKALKEIQRALREFSPELEKSMRADLAQVTRSQAVRAQNLLVATLGSEFGPYPVGITQARARTILNTNPFQGRVLREHVQAWTATQYNRVRDAIRIGMGYEESVPDIVARVIGQPVGYQSTTTGKMRSTGGPGTRRVYRGGVMSRAERDVEAVVRTAVTYVSNVGMTETFKANADVVSGVEYVSVLDDRTTIICAALDGTVWPVDSPDVVTPGADTHYNCRSILVPVIDYEGLGLPAPPDLQRAARDMRTVSDDDLENAVSYRRRTGGFGKVERIPSSVKAEQWLRAQRPTVQNRVLGKGRADLFRRGEVTLRDLIRNDNTVIPLRDLLQ